MNRFRIIVIALAFALIASPATSQVKEKITVAFPTIDPTAEVMYAYDLGLFDKAGLDCGRRRLRFDRFRRRQRDRDRVGAHERRSAHRRRAGRR
jgi:ABC-type nitrate/sulfonate/bicarbonate transport system substrate-binding protein